MKKTPVLVLTATVLLAIAGCAPTPATNQADTTPSGSATPTITFVTPAAPLPTGAPPTFGTGRQAPADPAAPSNAPVTWTPESRAAAADVAVAFMHSYARPGAAQPSWSQDLAQFTSPELHRTLQSVDTKYLTTTKPGTRGRLVASPSDPYNASVEVSASEGTWKLTVHRQPDASWVVSKIQPPARHGH